MSSKGELALRESQALAPEVTTALTGAQLKFISSTEFVPAGLRGNMPAIMACVATGRALGIDDMASLRSIHIIDGKATFSAELMVQLARKAGHSIVGEVSETGATVTGKRDDNGDTMTSKYTLEDAERAGLLGKTNWKKYPGPMCWARAVSQLCRMLFADCFAGASYTPEELGAGDVTADELIDGVAGEIVADEPQDDHAALIGELLDLADVLGVREPVAESVAAHEGDAEWLRTQIDNARTAVAAREAEAA